jgi:hypothetical protein
LPPSGGGGIAGFDRGGAYSRRVTSEIQVSARGVYDLGFHVMWRPKYRRLLLAGWATVGAVPAETVHRYTGTQNYRSWRKERAR